MQIIDIIMLLIVALPIVAVATHLIRTRYYDTFPVLIYSFVMFASITIPMFLVLDFESGSTVGIVTSVDSKFKGMTSLYIKTTANKEEKYCIERNEELESRANEYIGENVRITYGKRYGFYSLMDCRQSPVDSIELTEKGEK